MNLRKGLFYLPRNPSLALYTARKMYANRKSQLTPEQLRLTVKNGTQNVRWMNDFKCQGCKKFIGERYFSGALAVETACPSCAEWASTEGTKIFTTALKGNALRSGDCEVDYVIRKFLKAGDVFVDIGACIGYFTALAGSICGSTGKIYAFEPLPLFKENFEFILRENPNIHLTYESLALSDKSGESKFRVPKQFHLSSNFIDEGNDRRDFLGELDEITVKKVAFAEYFAGQRIDFIKMDVEGHEPSVLRSMLTWLKTSSSRPHVVFEHDMRNYDVERLRELETTLNEISKFGYRVFFGGTRTDAMRELKTVQYPMQLHLCPNSKNF